MFTGLVEELGTVAAAEISGSRRDERTLRLVVNARLSAKDAKIGDSIAINGCCLTVVEKARDTLSFDAGSETLSRTTFDRLREGNRVNLERSLALGDRLGGHLVTGHIDGLGTLMKRRDAGEWSQFTFRADRRLMRQMASKGSMAVDGVIVTVVAAEGDWFSVALIPHTLAETTLGSLQVGGAVNLETDLLAKYVERQMKFEGKL
jgi:riboflavin synthase